MLTPDDLHAIAELIKAEGAAIRKEVVTQSNLDANNTVIGKIVQIEIVTAKKETVAEMRTGFQAVIAAINGVEQRVMKKIEEQEEKTNHRIKELERHTGISRPEKN